MLGAIIGDVIGSPYEFESDKTKGTEKVRSNADLAFLALLEYNSYRGRWDTNAER